MPELELHLSTTSVSYAACIAVTAGLMRTDPMPPALPAGGPSSVYSIRSGVGRWSAPGPVAPLGRLWPGVAPRRFIQRRGLHAAFVLSADSCPGAFTNAFANTSTAHTEPVAYFFFFFFRDQ